MKKFTFTIEGKKFYFDTIKELHGAKAQLWEKEGKQVDLCSIKIEEVKEAPKGKVKLSFAKNENRDMVTDELENRSLVVYVEATNENLLYAICEHMENELGEGFSSCPYEENGLYGDAMYLPFEYGNMKALKEDVKHVFKMAKKELGIR